MNGKIILTGLLALLTFQVYAQSPGLTEGSPHLKLGLGYFSETVLYPGFVLEFEHEKMEARNLSLPQRVDVGFYNHPRNHMGLFLDAHQGLRRYFKSGFMLESALGLGVMLSFYNEEVWEVDETGTVAEASRFGGIDLMPSITFGLGYCLNKEKNSYLAFRPKVFWQFPYNEKALPHSALQLIYVHTL